MLAEIGAGGVPELIVINKVDAADPLVIARLTAHEPHSVTASARTGAGIEDLLSAIERDLPRPSVDVEVLLPYSRGDLVSRIHQEGEVLSLEHLDVGTQVHARVNPNLARRAPRVRGGAYPRLSQPSSYHDGMYDEDEDDEDQLAAYLHSLPGVPVDARSMGLDRNVPEGAWLAFAGSLSSSKASHRFVAWLILVAVVLSFVLTLRAELTG